MIGRIRDRKDFERLRSEGARHRNGPLWCTYLADDVSPPRVGFAIGRAVGNSVTRNRLRRRLRSILTGTDLAPGLWLVGATPAAVELTFAELCAMTSSLVDRAHRPGRS